MNIKIIYILSIIAVILFPPCSVLADYKPYKPTHTIPSYEPYSAENGSYRGEISEKTHRSKNVHVKGYKRKDGTYVRGHYRSKRK